MSALARTKKAAAQHEQERQYDKALALYARMLDGAEAAEEEVDVGLFNRAGDLALRLGDAPRAVGYFERALDLYAAGGLLNNAVALGVKILRHAPNHLSAHYTLGVLYGRKGFAGDARHHLLTYAVQMRRAGRADESARVLGEVAGTCADAAALRVAFDAYTALGGEPAQAGALGAESGGSPASEPPAPAAAPAPTHEASFEFLSLDQPSSEEAFAAPAHPAAGWDATGFEPAAIEPITLESPSFARSADDGWAEALTFGMPADDDGGTLAPAGPGLVFLDVPAAAREVTTGGTTTHAPHVGAGGGVLAHDVLLDLGDEFTAGPAVASGAARPRWADALPGEPPPLRLAELSRVVGVAPTAVPTSADDALPDDALPGHSVPANAARGRFADLLAVELGAAAHDVAPPPARFAPADRAADDEDTLDLGAWLRETAEVESTRLTSAVVPQSGDEQADFDATLRAFTSGVARVVEHEDYESHHDLGVAFREMGLVEEAIVEFQRAALAPGRPLRTLEALAQCFLDLDQPELALTTLTGPVAAADAAGAGDASLVAVHYLMGSAAEALGRSDDARRWYVRVVATDFRFRDAASRLAALPPPLPVR